MKRALTRENICYVITDNIKTVIDDKNKNDYGIRGNLTGISGDLTWISGNIDDCEITDEDRDSGIDINNLISESQPDR